MKKNTKKCVYCTNTTNKKILKYSEKNRIQHFCSVECLVKFINIKNTK